MKPSKKDSIEELVAQYVTTGKETYFETLNERLMPLMYSMAYAYHNTWHEPEDLLQEYRLQLHRSAHAFDRTIQPYFIPFYRKGMHHRTINLHRALCTQKRSNQRITLSIEGQLTFGEQGYMLERRIIHKRRPVGPENGVISKQGLQVFLKSLSKREGYYLSLYLAGHPVEDIAQKMNMQVGSMHDMRYRCLLKMRKSYHLFKGEYI